MSSRTASGIACGAGIALLVVVQAPLALAERNPLEPPDLTHYLRWGPVRARPGVSVSNLGWDNNVFFSTGDQESDGDLRVTVSPRLEGLLLFGDRAFLEFDEKLDYTAYSKFTNQNFLNNRTTARLTVPFTRLGVFTDLRLRRTGDRPGNEFDNRLERHENRVGAGVIVKLGWRTHAELSRSRTGWSHDDSDDPVVPVDPDDPDTLTTSELLDRDEQENLLNVDYRLTGQTRLTLEAASGRIEFDNRSVERDSRQKRLLVGVRFGEKGRLTGTLKIGTTEVDLENPLKRDLSEPVGEAQLAYRLRTGTMLRFDGQRRVGFSVFRDSDFFLGRSVSATVIHFLNRHLGFEVGGSTGRFTFPEADTIRGDRHDRTKRVELGLRFRISENVLGRRLEYSLKWWRWERDSNPSYDELDQTWSSIGLGAVVGF